MPESALEQDFGIDPESMLHYTEVASYAGVKPGVAHRWLYRSHLLPYVQLPRGRRVRGADLIAFLNSRYHKPDDAA